MGADISYKQVDSLVYDFYFTYYRDCRGVPFSDPSSATKLRCSNSSNSASITLNKMSIKDITPICSSATPPCSPENTYGTGKGIEQHIYRCRIDFKKAPYNTFLNCGGQVIVETMQCCRNSAVTTGYQNQNFYTYAMLDLNKAKNNSSPTFAVQPNAFICCNQPTFYYLGGMDTIDNDSLSYHLVKPATGWQLTASYSTGFSKDKPFTVYDPGMKGKVDPKADPPIGFYLDSAEGGVIFTPTKCGEVTVMAIEVREWRKNSSGKYENIGSVRRDMTYWVDTCTGNNPPKISGTTHYKMKPGDSLSFNVTTSDKVVVPPPPASVPPADTVSLTWSGSVPGAYFVLLDSTAREPVGQFRFRPKECGTYRFVAMARDNHCDFNRLNQKAFTIEVECAQDTSTGTGPGFKIDIPYSIQPNPNDGSFVLTYPTGTDLVQVTDVTGRQMNYISERVGTKSEKVNLTDYTPGVYFITLRYDGAVQVSRMVVYQR